MDDAPNMIPVILPEPIKVPSSPLVTEAKVVTNPRGVDVYILAFRTPENVGAYFLEHLIGNPEMRDCSSKATGCLLMIWRRG